MTEIHDDVLTIEKVRSGDQEAFRVLVDRYSGLVYHIAYRMCFNHDRAAEVVQEVFYRAYKSLDKYNSSWSFKTWLRRITVNYLIDENKKKRLDTISMTSEENQVMDVADSTFDPANCHYENEREELLTKAIAELPEKERMAITLRHYQDLAYEEIAEIMNMPMGTVMTQIHRGRKRLAQRLAHLQQELFLNQNSSDS